MHRSARIVRRQWRQMAAWREFRRDYTSFRRLAVSSPRDLPLNWEDRFPCLEDRTANTGFDRHYVYHTAWAARVLAETRPAVHVDIASSLYFVGLVSAFIPVQFYDYRPANLRLAGLTAAHADLMALPFSDASVASLSCLHVLEHVGLGRYGDPIDPQGDLRAINELQRVLMQNGDLLVAMPVGQPRIVFNAHRIYSMEMILDAFAGFELRQFALVPDDPALPLLINPPHDTAARQRYGCGCFWFRKPS